MRQERRGFLACLGKTGLLALSAGTGAYARAASTPQLSGKLARIIVPFGPGGTADLLARLMSEPLARGLGASAFAVENRAGAGGAIGALYVKQAAPDGLTLGLATVSTHAISPAVMRHPRYDPVKDFTPLSLIAEVPIVLVVSSKSNLKSMAALLAALKEKNSKPLFFGTPGVGSLSHILGELFQQETGTTMVHVPYKSSAEVEQALVAGDISLTFDNLPNPLPQIRAGRIDMLAVTGKSRNSDFPAVPTFAELGYQALNDPSWFGLVLPAGAPDSLVQAYNACIVQALRTQSIRDKIRMLGGAAAPISSTEFGALIRSTYSRAQSVAKAHNIYID